MKQNLKKMLLALIMGISIVGVGNVQAQEKEWVRSGDYDVYYIPIGPLLTIVPLGTAATFDGICEDIAIPRFAPKGRYDEEYYIYIYGGKRTSTGAQWITCYYTDVETNRRSNVGVYFTCNGDMIDLDRPDGCYAKECHEGTVDVGGVCVVPCTGIGEDGTASPKGCVPVNAEECDEKWRERTDAVGFVSCNGENDENRNVCVFDDPFFTDPEAAKYGRECTFVHEYTHYAERKEHNASCVDAEQNPDDQGVQGSPKPEHYRSEAGAYLASASCFFGKESECTTPACSEQMIDAMLADLKEAQDNMDDYSCAVSGVNCRSE